MTDICEQVRKDQGAYRDCPVKEILEREIKALAHRMDETLRMREVALDKAEKLMDKRLDNMNHLQKQIGEVQAVSMPVRYADDKFREQQKQIDELRLARATLDGKASATSVWVAYGFALIGWLLSIVSLLM